MKPVLSYGCRSQLKHGIWRGFFTKDKSPFCSLSLFHETRTRSLDPKKQDEEEVSQSQEAVAEFFEKARRTWGESDNYKKLLAFLDSSAAVHEINKVVAVSLGSLVVPRHPNAREASPLQHAFLLTLREWLIQRSAGSPCYTQDPIYTEIDHAILAEHGVEIIEDPRAWLEIDDQSIVVSISSNVPSREMVADLARPAVIIWNRVTNDDYDQEGKMSLYVDMNLFWGYLRLKTFRTDPCSPRVRALLEGYEAFEFGTDWDEFEDVVMYVRRQKTMCREE